MRVLPKIQFALLFLLFLLLPFHAFMVTFLKFGIGISFPYSNFIIHAWKELLLVGLFLLTGIELLNGRIKVPKWTVLDMFVIAYFALGIILTLFVHKNFVQSFYGFRYDYLFLIAYGIMRFMYLNDIQKESLKKTLFYSGSVTVLFGVIWYYFLPLDFLKYFGYSTEVANWTFGNGLPIYFTIDRFAEKARLSSTFSGPNHFGGFLLLFIPFAYYYLTYHFSKKRRGGMQFFLKAAVVVLAILSLYLTYSRAAYLGFFAQLFLFAIVFFRKHKKVVKAIFISLLTIVVLSSGVFAFYLPQISDYILKCSENQELSNTSSNTFIKCSSTRGHFDRNLDGLQRSLKAPLGYGLGTAGPASDYTADEEKGLFAFHPESWYLQVSVEMGYLGILCFLGIIFSAFFLLWKHIQKTINWNDAFFLFLALGGISVMALFLHAWEDPATSILFWSLLGMFVSKR